MKELQENCIFCKTSADALPASRIKALPASKYKCEGVNLFVAGGEAAHQEVFHFHLHAYPRFKGDGFDLKYDKARHFIKTERTRMNKIAWELKEK